jgi:hypothetical protein
VNAGYVGWYPAALTMALMIPPLVPGWIIFPVAQKERVSGT